MSDTETTRVSDEEIKQVVRHAYGNIARRFVKESTRASCCGSSQMVTVESLTRKESTRSGCCGPSRATTVENMTRKEPARSSCCGPAETGVQGSAVEDAIGSARLYSTEELANLPDAVTDASLGCGNPTAIANLKPGEVVLDLGSGGGIDCFLAARKVGPEGRVIGLDMTPDMIRLARRNAKKIGATNVDFRFGEMEEMPLPDASVDVIISNCVINLSPDKDAVFAEAYRVLRPGGRMHVSDIVVDGNLPQVIRSKLDAWAGCVAGALDESVYLDKIRAAGFDKVSVLSRTNASAAEDSVGQEAQIIVVQADGQTSESKEARALLAEAGISPHELGAKVASIQVQAFKPM